MGKSRSALRARDKCQDVSDEESERNRNGKIQSGGPLTKNKTRHHRDEHQQTDPDGDEAGIVPYDAKVFFPDPANHRLAPHEKQPGDEKRNPDEAARKRNLGEHPQETTTERNRALHASPFVHDGHPFRNTRLNCSSASGATSPTTMSPAFSTVAPREKITSPSCMMDATTHPVGHVSSLMVFPATGDSLVIFSSTRVALPLPSDTRGIKSLTIMPSSMTVARMFVELRAKSTPNFWKMSSLRGSLMRAVVSGTLNRTLASWHATRLSASSPVTAANRSVFSIPASMRAPKSQQSPLMTSAFPQSDNASQAPTSCSITATSCPLPTSK